MRGYWHATLQGYTADYLYIAILAAAMMPAFLSIHSHILRSSCALPYFESTQRQFLQHASLHFDDFSRPSVISVSAYRRRRQRTLRSKYALRLKCKVLLRVVL